MDQRRRWICWVLSTSTKRTKKEIMAQIEEHFNEHFPNECSTVNLFAMLLAKKKQPFDIFSGRKFPYKERNKMFRRKGL